MLDLPWLSDRGSFTNQPAARIPGYRMFADPSYFGSPSRANGPWFRYFAKKPAFGGFADTQYVISLCRPPNQLIPCK
jgi:hypothetical protein